MHDASILLQCPDSKTGHQRHSSEVSSSCHLEQIQLMIKLPHDDQIVDIDSHHKSHIVLDPSVQPVLKLLNPSSCSTESSFEFHALGTCLKP
jgi:hypothetical protein